MNLSVQFAGVTMKNPITTASGTFGSGMEYGEYVDLSRLGAVTTKGVANIPWPGNPVPRIAETASGMLNAIGLQNPGMDKFIRRDIPFLKQYDTNIIVNVCGKTKEDYLEAVQALANTSVDLLEINISCPNVKEGGIAFGQNPKAIEEITAAIKQIAKQPVIMKLSPNVTDITEMARAAQAGGADALSLINTLTGMKIDGVDSTGYAEESYLEKLDISLSDPQGIFLSNEINRILDTLTSIQGNMEYLNRPVKHEGTLFRNSFGKYETQSGHWYSCGSVIEYLCHDEGRCEYPFWRKASVEHNGNDYYITGDNQTLLDGLFVRVRGL